MNTGSVLSRPLGYKNELKIILVLAIPAITENVLQLLMGVVDTYFVGRIGTEAVAAVGLTNLVMNLYIAVFLALGMGTTAIISRNIGAGNIENANNALKQSLIMAILVGLIFGIGNLIFARNILSVLGAEESVLQYAFPYFLVVAVPSVFLCIMLVLSSALRGAGDTKTPMKVALVTNIVNIILDYILIFGIFGFSGLGILGVGLATTLSRMLGVGLLLNRINSNKVKLHIPLLKKWSLDSSLLKSITKIGLPAAGERLIMRVGQLVYGGMIIQIGTQAYAAHNIAGTIEMFSYLPGMGFGVAAATLVGQNLGAGRPAEAQRFGLLSYYMAAGMMVILGAVFYIFAPGLARIFSSDPVVIKQIVSVLRIISLFQPFLCITLVTTAALQGAGDTKFPMHSTFIGIWGIRVLGVYLAGQFFQLGLVGVWLIYALDVTVRGSILMLRYMRGKWKEIQIAA